MKSILLILYVDSAKPLTTILILHSLLLQLVGNKWLSNGNNVQGAGYSTCSSHLGVVIHSPRKVWCCLVVP